MSFWIVCKCHDITHVVIMIVLCSSAFPTRWWIVCIGWFSIVSITADADANNSSWSRSLERLLSFHSYPITTIYKKNRKREWSCVRVKCLYDTYVTLCCLVFVLCKIHRTELIELTTLFALHFEGRWCEELSLVVVMDGACMFVQLAW